VRNIRSDIMAIIYSIYQYLAVLGVLGVLGVLELHCVLVVLGVQVVLKVKINRNYQVNG
jgi:hypothetical protein